MNTGQSNQSRRSAVQSWAWVLMLLASVCWLVCAAIVFSNVEFDMFVGMGLLLWGLGVAVAWVISFLCAGSIWCVKRERFGRLTPLRAAVILATPILGMIGAWLLWTDLDFLFRLKLSERALVERCEQLIAEPDGGGIDGEWVGLFHVKWSDHVEGGAVRMTTVFPGLFHEAGVYYDPDGVIEPSRDWPEERSAVLGPWKRFYLQD